MTTRTRIIAGALALATIIGFGSSAMAQWENCTGVSWSDSDLEIGSCTAAIQSGRWQGKDLAWAFTNRGNAYLNKDQYDRAIQDYEKAISLNPRSIRAFERRGAAYRKKGEKERAIQDYDRVIRLTPEDTSEFLTRGNAYYGKGQYDRAIQDYNQAIERTPNDAVAFHNRGLVYGIKGQRDRGLQDYDQAIKLQPNYAAAWNGRCWNRAIFGQLEQALKDCNESLRLRPDDANTLDSRGFTYLKLGQFDNAITDYDAALRLNPKAAGSLYGRGLAKQKKGDSAGAEADITAAKAIDGKIAETFTGYLDPNNALMIKNREDAIDRQGSSEPKENLRRDRWIEFGPNGRLTLQGDGSWLETDGNNPMHRLTFRTTSDGKNELIVYDQSRDMYLRFKYVENRTYWRIGMNSSWNPFVQITRVVNQSAR